jgi:adenylate cyclase
MAELSRNKGLKVILAETSDEDLPAFEYVVATNLSAVTGSGTLELTTAFYEPGESAPVRTRQVEDTVTAEDENEWALQEKLVRGAMRAIRRRLTEKPVRIDTSRDRKVEEARGMAEAARRILRKGTTKHLLAATSMLRRALDLDRFSATAYAGLAEALVRKYLTWDGDPTFLDEARDNAAKALSLDAQCAEAHTALGFANHVSGHSEDAQREYRLAMQLDNEEWMAHRLLGAIYTREGNFKGASPLLQRAIGLMPQHIASYDHLYTVLQRLGRYEDALEYADKGIDAARRYLATTPDDMDARVHLALLYARLGNEDKARTAIEDASKKAPKDGYTAFHAACVYALLGDPQNAVACLKLSQARGYFIKSELVRNTDLDILHGLPEFQELAN